MPGREWFTGRVGTCFVEDVGNFKTVVPGNGARYMEVTGIRVEIGSLKSWNGGDQITGYVCVCKCDEGGQQCDGG